MPNSDLLQSPSTPQHPSTAAPPTRRVMSRDAAATVASRLLDANPAIDKVIVEHIVHSVTKIANGTVLEMNDGDIVHLEFPSQYGPGFDLSVSTNQLEEPFLKNVIAETIAKVPKRPPSRWAGNGATDSVGDSVGPFVARPLSPVTLYHQPTVDAMGAARGTAIPTIVDHLRQEKMNGAATVRLMNRSMLYYYREGLQSFVEETDSEVTVTARTAAGAGSGWAGKAHRNWAKVDPSSVAARAIDIARQNRTPVAVEPGRRTAILAPAAVAQLMRHMAKNFIGTGSGPLMFPNAGFTGRQSKLGMRVMDTRFVMASDPADPDGGFAPCFERGGRNTNFEAGYPTDAKIWIDKGILINLAWWVAKAALRNLTPAEAPVSFRLSSVQGTATATLDDMIADCEEGILVHRFSDTEEVGDEAGSVTGTTRDGCFLVKKGKIIKPVVNLRFIDSPFGALNRVQMIGAPERAAFGGAHRYPDSFFVPDDGLPYLPVIVPPLMIRDFNFSALANAV